MKNTTINLVAILFGLVLAVMAYSLSNIAHAEGYYTDGEIITDDTVHSPTDADYGTYLIAQEVLERYIEQMNDEPESVTWIDTWTDEYKPLAQEVWDEFVGDESLLDEDAYFELDEIVFSRIIE